MHVDLDEIAAIVNANRQPREDIYRGIHKALRLRMTDVLVAVGRLDCTDAAAVAALCTDLAQFCDLCVDHLGHENEFIHPMLEARVPASSRRIAGEHVQHEHDVAELRRAIDALAHADDATRAATAHALYLGLSVFVAHNLVHMVVEETEHNAVLWHHYDDAAIDAMHRRLVGSIPPDQMMATMRMMIPALSPAEHTAMLADIRATAPAPVFDAMCGLAREVLAPADWDRLRSSIE
ncbi:MAG: hypothetical protein AB7P21_20675 [Lautropia sp.]